MSFIFFSKSPELLAEDLHEMQDIAREVNADLFFDTLAVKHGFQESLMHWLLISTEAISLGPDPLDLLKDEAAFYSSFYQGIPCLFFENNDVEYLFIDHSSVDLLRGKEKAISRQVILSDLKESFEGWMGWANGMDDISDEKVTAFVKKNMSIIKENRIPVESIIYYGNSDRLLGLGRKLTAGMSFIFAGQTADFFAEDIKEMQRISTVISIDDFKNNITSTPEFTSVMVSYFADKSREIGKGDNLEHIFKESVVFYKSLYQGLPCYYFENKDAAYVFIEENNISLINDLQMSVFRQDIIRELKEDFEKLVILSGGAGSVSAEEISRFAYQKSNTLKSGRIPVESVIFSPSRPWLLEVGREANLSLPK